MSVPGAERGSTERARLRAVDAPPSAGAAPRNDRARSRLVPALAAALVVVAGLFVWQSLRAEALGSRVDALNGELADARQEIRAHEERLDLVRDYVDDLSTQLATLRELLETEPPTE